MLTSSTLFIEDDDGRTNAWLGNIIGNSSVVGEWKETSDCLNLPLGFFWWHFVSRCRGKRQLVNHSTMNVPGIFAMCKRSGNRTSF